MVEDVDRIPMKQNDEKYEDLIDKCLYGGMHNIGRGAACRMLAAECSKRMKTYSEKDREAYRETMINDAGIENYYLEYDTFQIKGSDEEYQKQYGFNLLYDPNVSVDEYVNKKLEHPLGICDIALFGVETQFSELIVEEYFQPISNDEDFRIIENLVFKDNIEYKYIPNPASIKKHFDNVLNDDERYKIAESLIHVIDIEDYYKKEVAAATERGEIISHNDLEMKLIDTIATKGFKAIYRKHYGNIAQYYEVNYPDVVEYMPDLINARGSLRISVRTDINNPLLPKNKYKIESTASTANTQSFKLIRNLQVDDGFSIDTYEQVLGLPVREFWNEIKDDKKDEVMQNALIEADNMGFGQQVKDELRNAKSFDDLKSKEVINAIKSGIINYYNKDEIVNLLGKRPPKYEWKRKKSLSCYHNQLGWTNYPQKVWERWVEIEEARDRGEITDGQAKELYKSMQHMKEMAKIQGTERTDLDSSEKRVSGTAFIKPSTYQPIRLRLYGSHKYINDIMNGTSPYTPIQEAAYWNTQVLDNIESAVDDWEWTQLRKNEIIHPEKYEDIPYTKMKDE
ncbi:hypothetical protein LCGC14_0223960 [marine sediment metagenome]|uniref:Uncharacterized protein n=1 Tax=marine sediment metagenome TaxID=412755 RepID=A0A0F9XFZ7_9ZZZZ